MRHRPARRPRSILQAMKPVTPLLVSILLLAGCAQLGLAPQGTALSTPMASTDVEWARKSGNNTVSGTASLKSGGEVHTCAGQSANLIPDSPYAQARMTAI